MYKGSAHVATQDGARVLTVAQTGTSGRGAGGDEGTGSACRGPAGHTVTQVPGGGAGPESLTFSSVQDRLRWF